MDPPVSDPNVIGTIPEETAAAEPPEDPPETHSFSQGLDTGPYTEYSFEDPIANSSIFVRPMGINPMSIICCTAVDVYGERYPFKMLDAHVTNSPSTHILSFIPTGSPAKGGT